MDHNAGDKSLTLWRLMSSGRDEGSPSVPLPLSSTHQFHTKRALFFSPQNPSVPHEKPHSSTHPSVPHEKNPSSTSETPQFNTKNPSVPHQKPPHFLTKNPSVQHTPQTKNSSI